MFICTGNICRSPLAHAVLNHLIKQEGLSDRIEVESSGTSAYHVGEPADSRMRQTALSHGVDIKNYSKKLTRGFIEEYDLHLTMDSSNYRDTLSLCRTSEEKNKVVMFREFDPEGYGDVPDPWYGGMDGFEEVWEITWRTCNVLFDKIKRDLNI